MDPVLSVIDEALARTGLSDAAASMRAVGNYALIKNMRAARGDDKRYSFQSLNQLAQVLGLECYFGPKRELKGFAEGGESTDLSRAEALRAGYLPIPWHDDIKRRGSSPVALQSAWLASEGLIPDHLRAVIPTQMNFSLAEANDTVAVLDTVAPQKGSSGIWCYKEDASIGICRAAFDKDLIVLLPGSEAGALRIVPRPAPSNFKILGRAVWLGLLPKG